LSRFAHLLHSDSESESHNKRNPAGNQQSHITLNNQDLTLSPFPFPLLPYLDLRA
jgi:hypothetical protein